MNIVVDAQLPYAAERFASLGRVEPVNAADLNARTLRDADVLIIRSVTRVDRALLDDTRVRFVGSATSGTDHVDLGYLRKAGIAFADAVGCNATAVAEYVVAALLHLMAFHGLQQRSSLGIVGFGHVGKRVHKFAHTLGMPCTIYDPPLLRSTRDSTFLRPLDEILRCDVVTLHVPLEHAGPDPTYHMVDDRFLDAMEPYHRDAGSFLINTARGAVVDSRALKRALRDRRVTAVLDVWEDEPLIDPGLFELAAIGTPHIAGHTLDAKRRAVDLLYDAVCKNVGANARFCEQDAPADVVRRLEVTETTPRALESLVSAACDLNSASEDLRDALQGDAALRAAKFQALRSAHPTRREFSATEVIIDANHGDADALETLGFRVTRVPERAPAGGHA